MYTYRATVIDVYDGDTFHAQLDLGFDVSARMTLRLYGVDAPEIAYKTADGTALGVVARDRVRSLMPAGTVIELSTVKDRKEKYGRYLASVRLPSGDVLISLLVREGLAKPYDGTGPRPWTVV